MAPRTILYTGKGGVGKTSVAAASARRCAAAGLRTVVLSTDPAHSLSDSLEAELGGRPTEVGPNLFGQEVQAQEEMERHWDSVQDWLGSLLEERGIDRIAAEELTVPPGMDELFSLLQIKRHHDEGEFDCVIVDCAPTGETLRLLSFPDVVTWWLERILPSQRKLAPWARSLFDVPLPANGVFDDLERLARNLVAMNGILRDRSRTTVRLVMNADRMVVKEAMRTFTYLNLYGYLTDAVVVNRLLPADGYFAAWSEIQGEQLELVRSAFEPVPVLTAPYLEREVIGPEMLDRLAGEVFGELRPGRRSSQRALAAARDRQRTGHPAGEGPVRREGRPLAQEDRARGDRAGRDPRSGPSCCRPPWPPIPRTARASRTARWRSPSRRRKREYRAAPRRGALPVLRPLGRCSSCSTAIRRAAPRELQDQVTNVIREFLLTMRSLIDWYLERIDDRPPEPHVEDIPIE